MARRSVSEPLSVERLFENIIFIAEIFADREDEEIPDMPVLELAKSFELKNRTGAAGTGLGRK